MPQILIAWAAKALTSKLLKKVVIVLLKNAAKRSSNKIDDELVKAIEEAFK